MLSRKKLTGYLIPLVIISLFTVAILRKTIINGLYPFPGDLLVSFYYPWYSGGWEGYDSWTTRKDFLNSDAIRQAIPWRYLAIEQFKSGHLPLWNPYSFSGTPLLANIQSAVFYPLNFVFWIFPFLQAWTLYIIVQPFLISLFTFLYLKQLKCNNPTAILFSTSFAGGLFFLGWLEIGVIGHTIMWLPVMLWALEKWFATQHIRFQIVLTLASVCSILAGHAHSMVNVLLIVGLYWLSFSLFVSKQKLFQLPFLTFWGVTTCALTSFQLLPAIELKNLSPLTENFAYQVFADLKTPPINLITILIPDFFGHPAHKTFWSDIYGDGTPLVGVFTVFFAIFGLLTKFTWRKTFFSTLAIIFLLYGFPGPIYWLVAKFHLPIFSESLASRSLFVYGFSICIFSALSFQDLISLKKRRLKDIPIPTTLFFTFFGFLMLFAVWSLFNLQPTEVWLPRITIAIKQTIIPLGLFIYLICSYLIFINWRYKPKVFTYSLIAPTLIFNVYLSDKILSFSPKEFFYPEHKVLTQIKQFAGEDRITGFNTPKLHNNFSIMYGLHSAEGYDNLRIKTYAEFMELQKNGSIPETYSKSDSDFIDEATEQRTKILDLTSVKYLLDKSDGDPEPWSPEPFKFPLDEVELVWQSNPFKIYKRHTAIPRQNLYYNYLIQPDNRQAYTQIMQKDFNHKSTIILDRDPQIVVQPSATGSSQLVASEPGYRRVSVSHQQSGVLLDTEVNFPGWTAYLNGNQTPILTGMGLYKAIVVPAGDHIVEFRYQPKSFWTGLSISLTWFVGTVSLIIALVTTRKLTF